MSKCGEVIQEGGDNLACCQLAVFLLTALNIKNEGGNYLVLRLAWLAWHPVPGVRLPSAPFGSCGSSASAIEKHQKQSS